METSQFDVHIKQHPLPDGPILQVITLEIHFKSVGTRGVETDMRPILLYPDS